MTSIVNILILVILLIVSLIVFFITVIYNLFYNLKLSLYLRKHRFKRWRYLTTLLGVGPWMNNPFRWIPYVFNNLDTLDKTILHYKRILRSGLKIFTISFAIFIVLLFIFPLLLQFFGGIS